MREAGLGVAVALLVAAAPASAATGCHASWPVVAHRAGGRAVRLPPGDTLPAACAGETGYATSESTIAVPRAGTLVYSPAHTENSMARSTDAGASWSLTYPAGEQPTSFWNTVDPFVIADWRTGRVFWSHATGPVRNESSLPDGSGFYLAAASGFQVYRSSDAGRSWQTADYSTAPTGDWEQVFTGPPPATGPKPSGYPDVVYLCANSPFEVSGPGRLCYRSLDGGATFGIAGYVSPSPGEPTDTCPPLQFRNGVVDSRGTIYIPATCGHGDYLAISHDEGSSYTWVPVRDAPPSSGLVDGGHLQVALDHADNLYALWPKNDTLVLEVSRDGARTWSAPMVVSAPGVHGIDLPALAAGAAGNVGIAYYASADPKAQTLTAYVTQTRDALDAQPLFYSGAVNDPAHPIFRDYGLSGGSPRTDFVGGAFDPGGTAFWAGVVEQLGPAANGKIPTTGYVGRLAYAASTPARLP